MTSIYEAEIRYKLRYRLYENQITARVFGALAMLPQKTVLLPFLKKLAEKSTNDKDGSCKALSEIEKLEHQDVSAQPIKIELWKRMAKEPDVLVTTEKVLIVIEVKVDSEPSHEQIRGQYEGNVR